METVAWYNLKHFTDLFLHAAYGITNEYDLEYSLALNCLINIKGLKIQEGCQLGPSIFHEAIFKSRGNRKRRKFITQLLHYSDVIMNTMASQITSVSFVYSTVLFRSKKISKPRFTGLCMRNSPVTGDFPAQRANNAENVSIWWRHHGFTIFASRYVFPRVINLDTLVTELILQ